MRNNIIQGVAAGAVSAISTEVITGAQLFSTNTSVSNSQAPVTQNTTAIASLRSSVITTVGNITNLRDQLTQTTTDLTNL
ncbi:hypothetical protein ACOTFB_29780, partial [Achromobacter xylosoxidans]